MTTSKKDICWNTIGVTLNAFTSLVYLVIVNRINGAENGGIFSFSYSVACLLFIIGGYATRTYQVADTAEKLNDSEYLLHKISTCGLMLIAGTLYCFLIREPVKRSAIIALTCLKMMEAFSDTPYAYIQKKDRLYLVGISLTIKATAEMVIFCVVDWLTNNMIAACIAIAAASGAVTLFFDMYYARRYIILEKVRVNRLWALYKDGFPIFIISFLSVYIINAQKYAMNGILSDELQAVFGIIIMPATFISLCGQYIMNPMLNQLVEFFKDKEYQKFKNSTYKLIKLLLLFWVLAEILAYLLGIPVLNLLYAISITQYKVDLLLIILGAVFYASAYIFQNCLIVMQKNNYQIVIYLISSFIAVSVSPILITKFGIRGATMAYLATMFSHCVMYYLYFNYTINSFKRKREC